LEASCAGTCDLASEIELIKILCPTSVRGCGTRFFRAHKISSRTAGAVSGTSGAGPQAPAGPKRKWGRLRRSTACVARRFVPSGDETVLSGMSILAFAHPDWGADFGSIPGPSGKRMPFGCRDAAPLGPGLTGVDKSELLTRFDKGPARSVRSASLCWLVPDHCSWQLRKERGSCCRVC